MVKLSRIRKSQQNRSISIMDPIDRDPMKSLGPVEVVKWSQTHLVILTKFTLEAFSLMVSTAARQEPNANAEVYDV